MIMGFQHGDYLDMKFAALVLIQPVVDAFNATWEIGLSPSFSIFHCELNSNNAKLCEATVLDDPDASYNSVALASGYSAGGYVEVPLLSQTEAITGLDRLSRYKHSDCDVLL